MARPEDAENRAGYQPVAFFTEMVKFFVSRDVELVPVNETVNGRVFLGEGVMARMWLRARAVAVAAGACCLAGGVLAGAPGLPAVPAAAQAGSDMGQVYVPLSPVRVLDTRYGTGAPQAPVGPGGTISLQVEGGVDDVPSSVTAVVLNVTVTDPTAASYVTVYPDGESRPTASNLNFSAGETIANLVTVPVGADGEVDFYNHVGSTDLVADLEGYYTASGTGSLLDSIGPVRVLDTRNGTGAPQAPVGPGSTISLQVSGVDGVPASGVTAVVLNVTATDTTAASYITVWPDGLVQPKVSNLNFTAGETIPNLVVVPLLADGKVDLYNNAGSTDLVADLSGYYTAAGAGYTPLGPVRVLDTRNGTGAPQAPVGPGGTISLQIAGAAGVPASGVTAVVLNVTATDTTASSYVTVWPDGETQPTASNLNFTAGETIPNLVIVPVGPDGEVDFYNHTGSTDLVADLEGYFTAGGTPWANATIVPGTVGENAGVDSLSCPSAGNCTASGEYTDSSGDQEVFVADEVGGTWGTATEIPGLAALNVGGYAQVTSVSCASAGNCATVGSYIDSSGSYQAFVANEVDGAWNDAIEVPGTSALNVGGRALVWSVSCPSAGNCTVGGYYSVSPGDQQAFVADQVDGAWGDAVEVPGTAANAMVSSVSCASAGNCAAGGSYADSSGSEQAFVAEEVDGIWNDAIEVPGTAALNIGGSAEASSVSCPSAGNCTIGGFYFDGSGDQQAFVADEVDSTWGDAIEVPGTGALNLGGSAHVTSVSCASGGNCSAVGEYADRTGEAQAGQSFVVSEVSGTWDEAIQVPGTAAGAGEYAQVSSVSCASAGNCVAGGSYADSSGNVQAFVISEVSGTWGEALEVPGTAALNTGADADVLSVSCPPTGNCAAGGFYSESSPGGTRAFVVTQN
jgi:hypothetical protein